MYFNQQQANDLLPWFKRIGTLEIELSLGMIALEVQRITISGISD